MSSPWAFSICLLASGILCGCVDYAMPGQRGNPPEFDPQLLNQGMDAIFVFSGAEIPDVPECGKTYSLFTRTSEPGVECDGYDFSFLYQEALRYFDLRKSGWECRQPCPQLQTFIVKQKAICLAQVATVQVNFIMRCSSAEDTLIQGLSIKTSQELQSPFNEAMTPIDDAISEHYLLQVVGNDTAQDCPFTYEMKVMYQESASCEVVSDYKPFIEKAIDKANLVSSFIECGPGCRKRPQKETGTIWKCDNNKVMVEYFFKVPCVRVRRVS